MSKILPFKTIRSEPLISPLEISRLFPVTITQNHFIAQSRRQIIRILDGIDKRHLLILGPCSIHDDKAAIHYAKKLKELISEVSDVFFPIMRFYFEKPRTGLGWKGLVNDPHLDGSLDLNWGLKLTRKLLVQLAEMEVPAAAEILDPISGHYFGELLSWGCIGARTSSSQVHRQIASGLPMPVGFKNTIEGNIEIPIHAILSAAEPHSYIGLNEMGVASIIHTGGNPHCHLVLRGSEKASNFDKDSVREIIGKLEKLKLSPKLLIDCSHDNSRKDHTKQPEVFENVMEQILNGNTAIRGLILESHLRAGRQEVASNLSLLKYAISITDSCIDWETTEGIILSAREALLAKTFSLSSQNRQIGETAEPQEFAQV